VGGALKEVVVKQTNDAASEFSAVDLDDLALQLHLNFWS
jgi:hypothetical protein